ncbi:uncharacterized protein ACLA_039610 [Aspergillus clavatus NRRL 1]|uniref:Uncharacterized protein n=1 Tax=Aspergillus clavatus (strain ATCC 1007 / CBS 513.65 / DSM 816 / NCTC 3887 / NRRL 1 / QM 1276 / 107) TaxID=344612 RepID=A1CKS2_ASPCL|nr:uncharacterized protein ACLA_039610 [Aspergillus clavatus NRRL 1]EAW09746.1 conserved hypothetical protein [Aspergillus clavatus NRRL 1]
MKKASLLRFRPFANIHQPLPRTPRESQQLLNALTSSFRRQLDHEYPSSSTTNKDGNSDNPASSVHATDKHLRSILDNPLFRVVPSKSAALNDIALLGSPAEQRLATEPMTVFDELVAAGSVTQSALFNCLKAQYVLATAHTGDGVVEAMKQCKAGSKIISWWFASDSDSRKMLLSSRVVSPTALKFMAAEGLMETAMVWLKMVLNQDIGGRDGRITQALAQQMAIHLLVDLLKAETKYGGGVVSSMRYFVEASKLPTAAGDQLSGQFKKSFLLPGAGHLCHSIVQGDRSQNQQISPELYDEYIRIIESTSKRSILLGSVHLYHPTRPDAGPLLQFTESVSPAWIESWSKSKRENFLRFGCDALRLLIDQERFQEASYLARFIQDNIAENTAEQTDACSAEEEIILNRSGLAWT